MSLDDYAREIYARSIPNHRAVQKHLLALGHRVELKLVMLWLGLISDEQWVRINS
jgi:hypothetical protein